MAYSGRLFRWALIAAALGASACLWTAWCVFPYFPWNDVRLAPAFALRGGINPYPLIGSGPLSTWIYGPTGILINLPATLAPTAVAALHTASLINAIVVLGPLGYILFSSTELRRRGNVVRFLALALAILLVPRPNLMLQVADHYAFAFGLLSCWWLARATNPSQLRLAAAAVLAAMAVWSKQLSVFILLAQGIYLGRQCGLVRAAHYVGWVLAFGMVALAAFAWAFGFDNLWLNLVAIPARLPWADWLPRFAQRWISLVAQIIVPAIILLVIWRRAMWPSRQSECGRFFQLATLSAAMMLPVGLAAFLKIGGDTNVLHSWAYLMPALLLLWLCSDDQNDQASHLRAISAVAVALIIHLPTFAYLPARPYTRQFNSAAEIISQHPQSLWFPQHPVLTYYSEGKLWHSEDGISTRYLAGYGLPTDLELRRHLPDKFRGVAYFHDVASPLSLQILPSFNGTAAMHEWKIYVETIPPPSSR